MPLHGQEFRHLNKHVGHARGATRLSQSLPSVTSHQRDWRGSERQLSEMGEGTCWKEMSTNSTMPWLDRGRSRLKDLGKMLRQLLTLLLVLFVGGAIVVG